MDKKILILGALPNENNNKEILYNKIKQIVNQIWQVIWTPIDTKDFVWSEIERSDRAYKLVKESDICIFELSDASPWALLEFGLASWWDKKTIIISKDKNTIHPLTKWDMLINNQIIIYSTTEQLDKMLVNTIKW